MEAPVHCYEIEQQRRRARVALIGGHAQPISASLWTYSRCPVHGWLNHSVPPKPLNSAPQFILRNMTHPFTRLLRRTVSPLVLTHHVLTRTVYPQEDNKRYIYPDFILHCSDPSQPAINAERQRVVVNILHTPASHVGTVPWRVQNALF